MRITPKSKRGLAAPVALVAMSLLMATTVSVGQAAAEMPATVRTVATAPDAQGTPTSGNVSAGSDSASSGSTGSGGAGPATMRTFSTASEAQTYWTPDRMARAAAVPTAAAKPKPVAGRTAPAPATAGTAKVDIHAATGTLAAAKPEALKSLVTRPYTNRPDRLNGKVFFSMGGLDYVCSGTVVNSNNKDMIDTAGHCVSDGAGHFATNWVFIPGYASKPSGGSAGMYPYGIWTARLLTTTAQWHYHANIKQDLAYGVVKPLNNRHIAAYLGGQGTFFNAPRNQVFSAFGYPQAAPFNGQDQRVSVSPRIGDDLLLGGLSGPLPMRINSNQTGGTSGGGWIVGLSPTTGLGHVNGHNSYRYLSGPAANTKVLYSPYYGNEALSLYNYTRSL